MTDRELEQRLRAWYADEVRATETAPEDLRDSLTAIPATTPAPIRPLSRRQGFTLLAAAAVMVVGGALAAGAGLLRFSSVVPPVPSNALVATVGPSPAETPSETQAETPTPAALRSGDLIAFIRKVDKPRTCGVIHKTTPCPTPRLWIIGSDGRGAHELFPDGTSGQSLLSWSPDGTHLLYTDENRLYLTDPSGSQPQPVDTGCPVVPENTPSSCASDSQVAWSRDGKRIVFIRVTTDADGYWGPAALATMDLETGQVSVLNVTSPAGGAAPSWSPDGNHIVFFRYGEKDTSGPLPPILSSIWMVDRDGQNLRQVSPATLDAQDASWSPDGARIVFRSPNPAHPNEDGSTNRGDIYTIRPDGSDVRRLTSDGMATNPTWTADGRILFTRAAGGAASPAAGWWAMDGDGSDPLLIASPAAIGVAVTDVEWTDPAWQPLGGAAIVPPPWVPRTATVVGPPAPTPTPTPIPDLAPGFSWTGSATADTDGSGIETATLLADGRVLVTGGCSTSAQLYDPTTGTFSPTGSMAQVRSSESATRLPDGRVLVAGGYNCGKAGQDGTWATAELYDPGTGTFSPTGSMTAPRQDQTATLLADGRVLIAGGLTGASPATAGGVILASYQTAEVDSFLATAEIYDPATGTFHKTGSMTTPHRGHTATLLQDGRVLVVGNGGESTRSSTAADLYDPASGTWSKTGPMKTGRWLQTATLLNDGRVLVLGGRSAKDSVHTSAEMYDPRSGTFSPAGSMREGRQQHTATLLPDGRVLIAAGYWSDGQNWRVLSSTEMYDPATGNFSPLGSMGTPRDGHTATLLKDGRVLFVGGANIGYEGGVGVTSAVLYQP